MEIFDISVPIHPGMPVWPGDSSVKVDQISKISNGNSANVSHISFGAHTGTHVDAPVHFIENGTTLDQVPLSNFIGEVEVIEIGDVDLISADDIQDKISMKSTSRVLFKTRNSNIWSQGELQFQQNFVALSPDAAHFLVDLNIKLVGIDYLSIAPFNNSSSTHVILLKAGISILEGIDLSKVHGGRYTLFCLPLKVSGIEGAPARAVLIR